MKKNTRLLVMLLVIAIGMLGLSYAFVPLYRMFCQLIGVTVPEIAVGKAGEAKNLVKDPSQPDRFVTVRFIANESQGVPVDLKPRVHRLKAKIAEPVLTAYEAHNLSSSPMKGVAVHMISGLGTRGDQDVSEYIDLQQCFCFEEQIYPGSTEVSLPLSFAVAPGLPKDIHTINFAYTLFESTE